MPTTRTCGRCQREKSVRGVWYLTPDAPGMAPFVCEGCFSGFARALAPARP